MSGHPKIVEWPKADGFRQAMAEAETAHDLARSWFTDSEALSSCPCFYLELDGLEIDGNCWRVHAGVDHPLDPDATGLCCLHLLRGEMADAERLRSLLDTMDWYGTWTLVDDR